VVAVLVGDEAEKAVLAWLNLLFLYNLRPKWHEGEFCYFETLQTKRDSDDGAAPRNTHEKPPQSLPYTTAQYPGQVA